MKLKKIAAFIIAVSMTVGLLSVFPASALTPVTGYAEEITVNESFDGSYSEDWFVIKNGSVADDKAKLVVGEGGSLAMKPEINTTDKKQIIAEFDINADITYTNPWSAAYIGISLLQMGATPASAVNGSWVGITNEKLILWHSATEGGYAWGNTKNNGAVLVDNTFGSKNISVRIIYEGTNAELYIRNNDATPAEGETEPAYVLAASLAAPSQKVASLTSGTEKLDSAITFPEKYNERYFAICTSTAASDESGWEFGGEGAATGGSTPAAPAEPEFVLVDNFVVKSYGELLMSASEKTALEATKTTLTNIVEKYGTDERLYLDASVDRDALNAFVDEIDALLAKSDALSSEYTALDSAINTVLGAAVSLTYVTSYNTSLDYYADVLDNADKDIYSEADIEAAKQKITVARELLKETTLTNATLEDALKEIGNAVGAIGICTEEGIPAYTQSFKDAGYTYADFSSSWYDMGYGDVSSVQIAGTEGALVKMDWNGNRRYMMQYRQKYSNYSVKATLTKTANGRATMGVRQVYESNCYEADNGNPSLTGGDNVVFISTGSANNLKTVYVGVRTMTRGDKNAVTYISRTEYEYNLATVEGALSNENKTATFVIKDFDDMIEFYVVGTSGNIKLATLYFSPERTGDKYTQGTLINEVTGEIESFSGVTISSAADSVLGFAARDGAFGVSDLTISTNVLPSGAEKYVAVAGVAPKDVELQIENVSEGVSVGTANKFEYNATYDRVKIYGQDRYKENVTISVLDDSSASVTAAAGDEIVKIDQAQGTITGVRRGTDIITATYGDSFKSTALYTVGLNAYTAPTKTLDSRITRASVLNSQAFKCLETGQYVIPVISCELPNGTDGILDEDCQVTYTSDDTDVIAYDVAKGAFVAGTKTGVTTIKAEVPYGTSGGKVTTAAVTVEVVAKGSATPGASYTGNLKEIIINADDAVSAEQYAEILENAAEAGFDISIGNTDEDKTINAGLIKEAVSEAVAEGTIDSDNIDEAALRTAIDDALSVRKVYDILADEQGSADEIGAVVFSSENPFEIDFTAYYEDLTDIQRDTVIARTHTQLKRKDPATLTKSEIANTVGTIIDSVKNGGAISGGGDGGKVTTSSKADKGGSFSASSITTGTNTNTVTKPLLTGDAAVSQAERFSDINDAAWAKEAIGALAYEGVVAGYEDGSILPNKEITRDEFVKLLVTALGIEMSDVNGVSFSDIEAGSWQEAYIAAAVKAGIVNGTGALTFGSGQTISRQDMATMIYRAILTLKFKLPSDKSVAFKDAEMVAGYALEAVNKLAASGVISGMGDGIFAPGARATRAQAICMIFNLRSLMK